MRKLLAVACYFMAACFLAVIINGCGASKTGRSETTRIPITIYKAAAIDIRAKNIDKIAVGIFSGKGDSGMKAAEALARALTDTLIYTVKKPSDVDSELLVNGLGIKPFMEKSELANIGKALQTDAFFLGEVRERRITDEVYNKVITEKEGTGEFEFIQNKEGKLEYKEKMALHDVEMECKTRVAKVRVNFKLYDGKTGNPIFEKEETLTEEVDAFCYRTGLSADGMSSNQENSLLDEVTQELCNKFVEKLTPPSKTELVIFEQISSADAFSNTLIKIGIDYAQRGEWKKAIDSFEQCQRINSTQPEANYNLGIAYKGYGWYEKALTQFKMAYSRNPKNNLYGEAMRKTKEMVEQSKKQTE